VMNCFTNICKSFIKTKNPNNFLSCSGFFILVFLFTILIFGPNLLTSARLSHYHYMTGSN
jgi:hypothetical protein